MEGMKKMAKKVFYIEKCAIFATSFGERNPRMQSLIISPSGAPLAAYLRGVSHFIRSYVFLGSLSKLNVFLKELGLEEI